MPYVGKVRVAEYPRGEKRIWLSRQTAKAARVKQGSSVKVRIGNWYCAVHVFIHNKGNQRVFVSDDIFLRMAKYSGMMQIRVTQEEIEFGPWVAIYAFEDHAKPPFGSLNPLLRDTFTASAKLGIPLYVISPGQITASSGDLGLTGWEYTDKGWRTRLFPWPTFLISKIVIIPPKKRVQVEEEMRRLEGRGCQFLSRSLGSKWRMYLAMQESADLQNHLPYTEILKESGKVKELVQRYGGVYIKPSQGTQGKSVYRLRLDSAQNWLLSFRNKDKEETVIIKKAAQEKWVRQQLRRPGGYLIQQEIPLIRDQKNRLTDFRWLLQKDGQGSWHVTGRIARTGAAGATTTNLSTGGQVCQAIDFLKSCLPEQKLPLLLKTIDEIALLCVRQMETSYGSMGEIGIDIGIDQKLQIWILEANPRPGRKMLKLVSQAERALSLRRPLEYARYATGFPFTN